MMRSDPVNMNQKPHVPLHSKGNKSKDQSVLILWIIIIALCLILIVSIVWRVTKMAGAHNPVASFPVSSSASQPSVTSVISSVAASSQPPVSSAPALREATKDDYRYFDDAVFAGDSLTEGILYYDYVTSRSVVTSIGASTYTAVTNHQIAINGSKSDTGWIPDRIASKNPKKIYLLFGSNDLGWMTISSYLDYYGQLISILQQKCPDAKIYIQSVTPIAASVENSTDWPMDNVKIDTYNAALKVMCQSKGLVYLDIASVLKGSDGKLPAGSSDDGVHLRSAQYKKWFDYLVANE